MTTIQKAKEIVEYFNRQYLYARLGITSSALHNRLLGKVEFTESEAVIIAQYHQIVTRAKSYDKQFK